jgi:hypothetical protein
VDEITTSNFSEFLFSYTVLRMEAIRSSEILVPLFQRFSNGVLQNTKLPQGEMNDSLRKFITAQKKI